MAEGKPESTHFGITRLPNLVNFARDQAAELVWENGQIGMRGLVSNPSRDSYSSPSAKPQVMTDIKKGMDTIKKSGLLGTADSFWTSKYDISLQEDHHPEGLPELYETNFHMFCENTRNNVFDKYNTEAHVVPVYKEANPGTGDVSKRAAKKPKHGTANSSKLYQAVAAHNRSIVSARQSGTSKQLGLQKYSFLRPEMLDKADGQSSDDAGTRPASRPSSSRRQNKPVSGLKRAENSQGQADLPIPPIFAETPEELPPDEQSEAVVPKDANIITSPVFGQKTSLAAANTGKSPDTEKCLDDQVAPTTSNGSRGASNDPTYFLKTSYEDTELEAWTPSDQSADEEQGGCCSQKAVPARSSAGAKRRRSAQVHNMSERRRRDKINKKMRELRDLVPNSNKVDNASMLDQAIEYTKILQLQLQMMSMGGAGFCVPPVMLATGMQHLQPPNSADFPPVSLGIMGMRMPMGFGYSMAPFGFPGQVMPMSMPRPPFIPLIGGPSHFTFPSPNISSAATPSPFLGSPSMLSYTDSVHPANSSRQ